MVDKLRIKLRHLPARLPDGFDANRQAWGMCEFYILDSTGGRESLLTVEWHVAHAVRWFINEFYPVAWGIYPEQQTDENTAQAINRIRALRREEFISEKRYAQLQQFNMSHNLTYAFPSVPMPHIYLAYTGNGEISHSPSFSTMKSHTGSVEFKTGEWSYHFDMDDFLDNSLHHIKEFLEEWDRSGESDVPNVLHSDLNQIFED